MRQQYLVTVGNTNYKGKTLGVQFNKGRALLDERLLDPAVGISLDEVVRQMEVDFGYTVEPFGDEPRRTRHLRATRMKNAIPESEASAVGVGDPSAVGESLGGDDELLDASVEEEEKEEDQPTAVA